MKGYAIIPTEKDVEKFINIQNFHRSEEEGEYEYEYDSDDEMFFIKIFLGGESSVQIELYEYDDDVGDFDVFKKWLVDGDYFRFTSGYQHFDAHMMSNSINPSEYSSKDQAYDVMTTVDYTLNPY